MDSRALLSAVAWPLAFVAVGAMGFTTMRGVLEERAVEHHETVRATPTIVKDLRQLARLETLAVHVEKVIDVTDRQPALYGLVEAHDRLLFVAVGEVTLGVDLGALGDDAVAFDPATGVAHLTLPEPTILTTAFDEDRSYVHARTTDLLATANPGLEQSARKEALAGFEEVGRDPRHLAEARAQAERQLKALAGAWGVRDLVIRWAAP